MRAAFTTSLLLVSMLLLSGCGSSSQKAAADASQTQAALAQRTDFKKRCGDPIRFPISDECVQLAGNDGSRFRRQSDLTVAMWRACTMLPSSAETIRQEAIARGDAKTEVGQKMIGEMERTEQHSDSPCVAADLRDLDCVAGNSDACETARNNDAACTAWLNDNDTQERLHCIDRAVHDPACMATQQAESSDHDDSPAASAISDTQAQAEDCRRMENACLHSFDECANAKDALEAFLHPQKSAPPPKPQ
jgi:hypothetical protein